MIGGLLFSDKTNSIVSLRWLPFLEDFDRCSRLSWGFAVLCFTYNALPNASNRGQMSRDLHVGRILRLRYEIDTLRFNDFIWTLYTLPVWSGLCPAWYHPTDRVKRQFGFEKPIPVDPVNLDMFLTFNARGEDQWWPTKLDEYYGHWMAQRTLPEDAPLRVTQPRDSTVLATDAPAPRRRAAQQRADIKRREPRMGQGG
ncbi:hypothetical protein PIB30_066600 [Stylosanthes scabra]|uniref:Aminotransferase-like plant mobile domain-containing protein n=1 Tax=Stylosanthes scabra TaxID=79078 RepID=A0ABU6YJW8_9FABA|nr:hypothetical protein [Stylosanthes scabra]